MAGRENSPIDPEDVLRLMKYPISAKQLAQRLGRSTSSIMHVIDRHLGDRIEEDMRLGSGRRRARHFWRKGERWG